MMMQISSKQDTIPGDFPWDKCRKLYSVPNGFATRFLEGKCQQDFEYLTTATFIDAKAIMTEWMRNFEEVKSGQTSAVTEFPEPDQKFLENLVQRAGVLPGEQYFLILAVIFLAQCTRRREMQLLESFFAAHDADKAKAIDINSPEISWLDLAELLSISFSKLRPVIRERAVAMVDSSQKPRLRNKRAAVDDTFVYDAPENLQLRRRRSRNNDKEDGDEPSFSSVHDQRVSFSQNQPVSTGGYFVIPKQLCGLTQSSAGIEFPAEDNGMAYVEALLTPDSIDQHLMQILPIEGARGGGGGGEMKDVARKEAKYIGHDYYLQDPYDELNGNGNHNPHRYSSRVSFNEYPMGNNNSSLVSRRQKKNKKMFILTVRTESENGQKTETKQTQPISMKGIVALETLRYRVQLNAFQNEKKKFSRNSSDLHDALWIFEVTLLISDGPTTLDQQFRIGNYYALQRGLGRPFDVMFKTPLEYFCELGRQISVFYHTRRDVFPPHLINLAVQYFDNMKVIVNERSPTTASTTIADHEREEALRAEELNHLRQHELWLLGNHPHLHPSWSMVYKAMKAQCSLAEVTSMSCVTLFRQVPALYPAPKLSMTTVMIDDLNSAYFSSQPGLHAAPPPGNVMAGSTTVSYAQQGPPASLQALIVDHIETLSNSEDPDVVEDSRPRSEMVANKSEPEKPRVEQLSSMLIMPVAAPAPAAQQQQAQSQPQPQFPKQMPKPIQRPAAAAVVVPVKPVSVAPVAAPSAASAATTSAVPNVSLPVSALAATKPAAVAAAAPVKTVHFQPLPQGSSEHSAKHGAGKAMKAISAMAASASTSTSSSSAIAPAGKITLSEALKFIAQSSTSAASTNSSSRYSSVAVSQDQPITQAIIAASSPAPTKGVRGRKPGSSRTQGTTVRFTPPLLVAQNALTATAETTKSSGVKRKLAEDE